MVREVNFSAANQLREVVSLGRTEGDNSFQPVEHRLVQLEPLKLTRRLMKRGDYSLMPGTATR
jgi:hypothetical protein